MDAADDDGGHHGEGEPTGYDEAAVGGDLVGEVAAYRSADEGYGVDWYLSRVSSALLWASVEDKGKGRKRGTYGHVLGLDWVGVP